MIKRQQKRKIGLLTIGLLFGLLGNAFAEEPVRYRIQASLDAQRKQIKAFQEVTFTNNTSRAIDTLYFHIYANRHYTEKEKIFMLDYTSYFKVNPFPEGFQSGSVNIKDVETNGQPLSYSIDGKDETLLKVSLKNPLKSGESGVYAMHYTVRVPHAYGRFGWHKNIFALSRFYPILAVLNEDGWNKNPFYPFHRPFFSEASYYSVELTVPSDYTVIHSGSLVEEKKEGATKRLAIKSVQPIREFTAALSPDYRMVKKEHNGVTIQSFYLPGNEERAKEALNTVVSLFDFYTKRFGPYPYPTFSIAPVYLGYGGEQMSNMILIDTRVYLLPHILERQFNFLIAHEAGHQWFYNLVGVDEFSEMWLEEGVNSYFILAYLENRYGKNAEVLKWPKSLEWVLPNFSFRRARDFRYNILARTNLNYVITSKLSSYTEPSSIFSITYGKGSAITSMLRYVLGEEAFKKVFERIFKKYRFKNLSTEKLQQICEEESGKRLDWFFNEWLYSIDNCDYAISRVSKDEVTIKNRGHIIMPLTVQLEYQDGEKETRHIQKQEGDIQLAVQKPVKRVAIDPKRELLDIDRTNNFYPRKFYFKPVAFHGGLYDFSIFVPEDGYSLVVGPDPTAGLGIKASFQKPYEHNVYALIGYDISEKIQETRIGYQMKNLFRTRTTAGFEIFNISDYDDGQEDLAGGKVYLRKELRPIAYGLTEINDHVTLYLIRNRSLNRGFSLEGAEDSRNVSYLKKDESIVGVAFHMGHSGPFPDVRRGFKVDTFLENSGHFLGATQYFYRGALDVSFYHPLTLTTTMAYRIKYGWGYPDDKNLYELGGATGLRGYDRKTLRGSHVALGSMEVRFPLVKDIGFSMFDNLLRLEDIGGVVFMDIGQDWFNDVDESTLKKDAGLGLRLAFSIGSFFEKVILRADVAQAIHEDDEDPRYWVGINHTF